MIYVGKESLLFINCQKKSAYSGGSAEKNYSLLKLFHLVVRIGKIMILNKTEGAIQVSDLGIRTVLFLMPPVTKIISWYNKLAYSNWKVPPEYHTY